MRRRLFHIVSDADWRDAEAAGEYAPASIATEGFIHLSAPRQLAGTVARFYAGRDDLRVLELDEDALGDALRWEEGEPGELFPHLYRALRLDEVVAVRRLDEALAG